MDKDRKQRVDYYAEYAEKRSLKGRVRTLVEFTKEIKVYYKAITIGVVFTLINILVIPTMATETKELKGKTYEIEKSIRNEEARLRELEYKNDQKEKEDKEQAKLDAMSDAEREEYENQKEFSRENLLSQVRGEGELYYVNELEKTFVDRQVKIIGAKSGEADITLEDGKKYIIVEVQVSNTDVQSIIVGSGDIELIVDKIVVKSDYAYTAITADALDRKIEMLPDGTIKGSVRFEINHDFKGEVTIMYNRETVATFDID